MGASPLFFQKESPRHIQHVAPLPYSIKLFEERGTSLVLVRFILITLRSLPLKGKRIEFGYHTITSSGCATGLKVTQT